MIYDWPRLWAMMQDFHAAVKPNFTMREADAKALMDVMPFVKMTDGGFIAGQCVRNPLNTDEIMGKEFLWWARDGSGAALRRAFRDWCIGQGAGLIDWSCPPDNARVRRFYERIGTASEIIYQEVI